MTSKFLWCDQFITPAEKRFGKKLKSATFFIYLFDPEISQCVRTLYAI